MQSLKVMWGKLGSSVAALCDIKGLIVSQYDFGEEEREKTNHGIPTSRSNVRSFCTVKLPLNN